MKLTLISVVDTWLCATGVAIISCYSFMPCCNNSKYAEKIASECAAKMSRSGDIAHFKPANRHSSVVKKTTAATVSTKEIKVPTWVENPIYPTFKVALDNLTWEIADIASDGEVELNGGFSLVQEAGKPVLKYPEEYVNVSIGGVSFGDVIDSGRFDVRRKRIENSYQEKIDEVVLGKFKRLNEPEFYCTDVTYSLLPATRQVVAIGMHGSLELGDMSKSQKVIREIENWMKDDYGAVDLRAELPADTLAYRKFKVGDGMIIEVKVCKNGAYSGERGDSHIDISLTVGELDSENKFQCQALGQVADEARVDTLASTGVNYYTVREKVNADRLKGKVVY